MRLRRVIYAAVIATFAVPVWAQTPATLTVTSPTIKANETVPVDHTADGKNYSPAINWSGAPANTKQFALVYDDPDVVFGGQTFVHWVVYKIPGTAKGLPGELPMEAVLTAPPEIAGTIQGLSGFKRAGYRGPAPPAGKPHHYTWTVYARRRAAARTGTQSQSADGGDQRPHHRPGITSRDLRAQASYLIARPPAGLYGKAPPVLRQVLRGSPRQRLHGERRVPRATRTHHRRAQYAKVRGLV